MKRICHPVPLALLGLLIAVPSLHADDVTKARPHGFKVIIAYSSECPISNEYSPTLKALTDSLPKSVEMLGLCVDYDLTKPEIDRHAKEHGLSFPIVRDAKGIARSLGMTKTPEAVIVDDRGTVHYRGRIDDQFAERGKRNANPEHSDLKRAIDAVAAGQEPAKPWPIAVGCPVPDPPKPSAGPVYTKDVLPILQANCQECHRKGQVGPFALETYEQARKRAEDIAAIVSDRRMPPWKAIPDYGPKYKHDKSLSEAEIKTLAAWADRGAPEGDQADAPVAVEFRDGWTLGTPDLIIEPEADFEIPASGGDVYRCFVIPTNLPKDVYVRAAEVRAGNRRVVHHVLSYVDISGEARKKDKAEPGQGYECFGGPGVRVHSGLFGWAPGNEAHFLPDGIGVSLPKGADVIMQVHYHPDGKPETDRSRLGLYFCKTPVKQGLHNAFAANMRMQIPAGDSNKEIHAEWKVPVGVTVLSATPHMHQIGHDMAMDFRFPDGKVKKIVKIADWDFNWQLTYWLQTPLDVPEDSVLEITAHFDNSAANPRNPNKPPKPMHWGEATTDEMCIGFVAVVKTGQDLTRPGERDDLGEILMKQMEEKMKQLQEERRKHQEEAKKKAAK